MLEDFRCEAADEVGIFRLLCSIDEPEITVQYRPRYPPRRLCRTTRVPPFRSANDSAHDRAEGPVAPRGMKEMQSIRWLSSLRLHPAFTNQGNPICRLNGLRNNGPSIEAIDHQQCHTTCRTPSASVKKIVCRGSKGHFAASAGIHEEVLFVYGDGE